MAAATAVVGASTVSASTVSAPTAGASTATITAGGPAVTVKVTPPASRARLSFVVARPATVIVTFVSWTFPADGATAAYLANHAGLRIRPLRVLDGTGPWQARAVSLRAGRYFIVIDTGRSRDKGSVTVRLTGVGRARANGTAIGASIKANGQPDLLAFSAKAGMTVVAGARGARFGAKHGATLGIENGDGVAQGPVRFAGGKGSGSGPVYVVATLARAGTYYLAFRPAVPGSAGSAKLTLRVVPPQVSAAIGGRAVTAQTKAPGVPALVSFNAPTREAIAVVVHSTTFSGYAARVYVTRANGIPIGPEQYLARSKTTDGPVDLPKAGRYTLVIDPGLANAAGRITLSLIKIIDVHLRAAIGGRPVTAVIRHPAQRALVTFPAKASQQVLVTFAGSTFASSADTISLDGPNGSTVDSPIALNAKSGKLPAVRLSKSGTYTVVIDPSFNGDTGKVTVKVGRAAAITNPTGPRRQTSPQSPAHPAAGAPRPGTTSAPGPEFSVSYHFSETDFFFTGGFDQGFLNTSNVNADWRQTPDGAVTASATQESTIHLWLYHDVCIIARLNDTHSFGQFNGALLPDEAAIAAGPKGSANYAIGPNSILTTGTQTMDNREYDTPECTSGQSSSTSSFQGTISIGGITGSMPRGATSASGHSSCGTGVSFGGSLGTLVTVVNCSLDWSISAPPDITCETTSVTLPATTAPVTDPFKPFRASYGVLPLTFTGQSTDPGSLCTLLSNAGALPVDVSLPGVPGGQIQIGASVTRATLNFFPADDRATFVPICNFAALRSLSNPNTTPPSKDFKRTSNCLLTSSAHSSDGIIVRWSIPGFSQYEPNEQHGVKVYTTEPLTFYVDLAALPNPPGSAASFHDVVQSAEAYIHTTLIDNLPTVDKIGFLQDPPAHLLITDPLGRTVGRRGTGKVVTFPGAGYAEIGGRSIAWILEPVPGVYRVTASGHRGGKFRSDFAILQFLGHGTAPLIRHTPHQGTLGAGGIAKSTFDIRGDALAPVLRPHESRTRVTRGRPVRFSLAGSVIPFSPAKVIWSFGDRTKAKGMTVTHRFRKTGRFTPVVTVINRLGTSVTIKLPPIVVTR